MADVFLSYARGDRSAADRLANAIGETGLTVWWDRHIKGGAEFSRDIQRQLDEASKILVLWSRDAVDSRWVRDEASVAADSGRLVSATIDGTPPPLGFRQFQTVDLKGWSATGSAIPSALAEALEVEPPAPAAARAPPAPRRRLVAAGISALLLAGVVTIAVVQPEPFDRLVSSDRQSEELSLAIMPFATQTGAGIDYMGVGLAGALADSLAPLSGLKITAGTSTKAVAGLGLTAPEIGRKLNITHLVEGDVHRNGDRYAISVRLVEARTSEQIWARSFEARSQQLQRLKNRMAHELAGALRARLGVGQGEIVERGDVDPRAYEAYLRALERVSVRGQRDARSEAIRQFRLAASIQPDFADAHAGYAYLLALSVPHHLAMTWEQLIREQQQATGRALKLDPDNDLALIAKSIALHNFYGNIDEALAIDQTVLRRSPDFVPAHYSVASSLWMRGRAREAIHHLDQAIALDPFDTLMHSYRAKILYSLGDYQGVRDAVEKCPDPCAGIGFEWALAMTGFATPAQLRQDLPRLMERGRAVPLPPEILEETMRIAEALVLGRPYKPRPIEEGVPPTFVNAAISARLESFEQALRYARIAADRQQADDVLDILNEGRLTFTPEQRADPRYHALFRHPKLVGIATARRKEGVLAGLPVLPIKTYSGR
ncbi:MAG: TIR domain-containing protein [Sphingomicrobium sp.]